MCFCFAASVGDLCLNLMFGSDVAIGCVNFGCFFVLPFLLAIGPCI